MNIKFPGDSERITIIGKTGSGKTQGAAWLFAHRSYHKKPWMVFDFKYDSLLGKIVNTREYELGTKLPKKPGIYTVHPVPGVDNEKVEDLLWQMWERENIGLFIDEGYMIDLRSPAFQAILTQGRSKKIPVILLTQRPTWLSRFAFSEADYIQLFKLTDKRDILTVKQFMPLPIDAALPGPYYSWWYDNAREYKAVLHPVPPIDNILSVFRERNGTHRHSL